MVLRGLTALEGLQTAQLLWQSWTIDAQGAWMPALAGASPLCSWLLTSGTISSLEAVPLCSHNFCRNNCWRKQKCMLGGSSGSLSGHPHRAPRKGCSGKKSRHHPFGRSSPEPAGPLGCSSTGQVPGFAKPFPPAQKVTFHFYSTNSCP